ncbi:unnamed protein product, partial [Amoebophrya sp. A25]
ALTTSTKKNSADEREWSWHDPAETMRNLTHNGVGPFTKQLKLLYRGSLEVELSYAELLAPPNAVVTTTTQQVEAAQAVTHQGEEAQETQTVSFLQQRQKQLW